MLRFYNFLIIIKKMVEGDGFEPPNPMGADLQSAYYLLNKPIIVEYSSSYELLFLYQKVEKGRMNMFLLAIIGLLLVYIASLISLITTELEIQKGEKDYD